MRFWSRKPRPRRKTRCAGAAIVILCLFFPLEDRAHAQEFAPSCGIEWRKTDFNRRAVDLTEIISGGVCKDQIPAIDNPQFLPVTQEKNLVDNEAVVSVSLEGHAKAYPLRILIWHEIVNDEIGSTPIAVTYCPLCNAAIVFERRLDGRILDFGTTGRLRYSDLIMYDRQSESWWQQFSGEAIVGELTESKLKVLPARLESWKKFKERYPDGLVQVPNDPALRPYGTNPYVGYDSAARPFLYMGNYPEDVPPMARVVAVGDKAWSLSLLRRKKRIESGDLVITWEAGQSSALDTRDITKGREVGNIVVQKKGKNALKDVAYDVVFAFVFHAFHPKGRLHP